MIELLESLEFWHWWVFGGALVVVETLLPSGILYGAALAAFIVGGGFALDVEFGWQLQIEAWIGMTVVLGWAGRTIRNRSLAPKVSPSPAPPNPPVPDVMGEPAATEEPKRQPLDLETPAPAPSAQTLIGGVYTIWAPITGGSGTLKIKGAAYVLSGPDLPAGSRIKVTADDGTTLTVEAAE